MVAVEPGEPKTSNSTRLGLYPVFSSASAAGFDTTLSDPKMPCNREMLNPTMATTRIATMAVH